MMASMFSGGHVELAVLAVQADVEALAERLPVGLGHAEQARDDLDREVRGEVGDRVELGQRPSSGSRKLADDLADHRLERGRRPSA